MFDQPQDSTPARSILLDPAHHHTGDVWHVWFAGIRPDQLYGYRGLVQKIPYLKDLGATAVELMPVQEFNEHALIRINPLTGQKLRNYWGYDPVAFFAPKASYSYSGGLGQQKLEFKEMVKAFILMNLVMSLQAAYTAPIIMMSQNRQVMRNRLEAHNDYLINQKAEEGVRAILEHLAAQGKALAQMHQLLLALQAQSGE
jgi:hypothetical protein